MIIIQDKKDFFLIWIVGIPIYTGKPNANSFNIIPNHIEKIIALKSYNVGNNGSNTSIPPIVILAVNIIRACSH